MSKLGIAFYAAVQNGQVRAAIASDAHASIIARQLSATLGPDNCLGEVAVCQNECSPYPGQSPADRPAAERGLVQTSTQLPLSDDGQEPRAISSASTSAGPWGALSMCALIDCSASYEDVAAAGRWSFFGNPWVWSNTSRKQIRHSGG